MNFDVEDDYREGSIMHDYCEAITEDSALRGMREAHQAINEVPGADDNIDPDAERALWDAMHEIERAMSIQSEAILRDLAEGRSERTAANDGNTHTQNHDEDWSTQRSAFGVRVQNSDRMSRDMGCCHNIGGHNRWRGGSYDGDVAIGPPLRPMD